MKHTPGPWIADEDSVRYPADKTEIHRMFAYVFAGRGCGPEEAAANMALISSAPELLQALKYARRMMTKDSDLAYVDAVIAKATGENT